MDIEVPGRCLLRSTSVTLKGIADASADTSSQIMALVCEGSGYGAVSFWKDRGARKKVGCGEAIVNNSRRGIGGEFVWV